MATVALTAREKLGRLAAWRRSDPAGSVDATGHTREDTCLNCRTPLVGKFCHACGQHTHVHRTLAAFGHDLLHGVLHLEGKAWHTLPKLLFRPGELTRRYIAGERARFVSPLAMFLFSVFLMFAVVNLVGSPTHMLDGTSQEAQAGMRQELTQVDARLAELRTRRDAALARGDDTAKMDRELRDAEQGREVLRGLIGSDAATNSSRASDAYERGRKAGTAVKAELEAGGFDAAYKKAKENPSLLIYKLQTNAYKYSWALILISVPFVSLLFLWRWRPVYDHTVFVTYSITAVSILVILGSALVLAGMRFQPILLASLLFIPWHMYRQLRGGYELRRFSALWRTAALIVFAGLALLLFTIALVMLGVLA